jgi:thymidine phosphorylase
MISGRGLGHTGGTLDKLASIPGYDIAPDLARFRAAVRQAGCAIVGPTAELAPADRRLYAIRDVTATVDSVPLITASILSKKLAAGLDALVMDVKVGSGAFAGSLESAQALAESLVTVAADAGLRTVAWLTDMNQVLGHDVGNALEMREAIDFLAGRRREARLHAVTSALAREMLVLGDLAGDHGEAAGPVERALTSGAAAERFARMVVALGGPGDLLERPDRYLAEAPVRLAVTPERAGVITRVDARLIGLAVVTLGGGRRRADDTVDPAVGLADVRGQGEPVGPDRPLAVVHARSTAEAAAAAATVRKAMVVGDGPGEPVGSRCCSASANGEALHPPSGDGVTRPRAPTRTPGWSSPPCWGRRPRPRVLDVLRLPVRRRRDRRPRGEALLHGENFRSSSARPTWLAERDPLVPALFLFGPSVLRSA